MSSENDTERTLARARTLLRSHSGGTLLCDGTPTPIHYIIDPDDGALLINAGHEMIEADDCVLVVPEDRFDAPMRVTLSLQEEPEGHASDRYLAYHRRADRALWARALIGFAKIDSGGVADGDALMEPNPLRSGIGALCKILNSNPGALREVCRLLTKISIDQPTAVGVDDEGCDVRADFGVVRMGWPSPVPDEQTCEQVIVSLIDGVS